MRQLISIIPLCLILLCSLEAFSQRQRLESREFINFASASFRATKFRDSNALYTMIVQILLDSRHPSKIQVSVTDTISAEVMKSIKTFKNFNFHPLMNNHSQVAFQFPIAILIGNSKDDRNPIELETLGSSIAKMFNFEPLDAKGFPVIELSPLNLTMSLKTYD